MEDKGLDDQNTRPMPPDNGVVAGTSHDSTPHMLAVRGGRQMMAAPPTTPFVLWPAEPERKNAVELPDILAMLRRRLWVMVLTFLLVVGVAATYLMFAPRVYEATATLQAHSAEGENDLLTQALGISQPRSIQTQVSIVGHELLRQRAIRALPRFKALPHEEQTELLKHSEVVATPIVATDLIEVSARAHAPQTAVDLANAVSTQYVQFSRGKNRQGTSETRQYVQQQLSAVRAKLNKSQADLRRFKESNGVFNLSKEADALVDQAQDIEKAWSDARSQKAASVAQLAEMRRVAGEIPETRTVPNVIERRPEVEAMKLELMRLETERIRLLQDYMPTSDPVKSIDGQIADLRRKLQGQAQTQIGSWSVEPSPVRVAAQGDIARLRGQVWALEAQGHAYKNALAAVRARLKTMPRRELTLGQLTLDVGALQRSYDLLNDRLQVLRINEQAQVPSANVMFLATRDGVRQIKPLVTRTIMIAVMVGLLLALGLAALADQLDDRLHTEQEARRATRLPVLAGVPFAKERQVHSLYERLDDPSPLLEVFQLLHTNIEFSAADEPLHVIAVASSLPNEGKSVSALNLAIAAAMSGRSVILVDCDLRRPTQHRLCALPNRVGLSSVLTGAQPLEEALQRSQVPGLRVLTSGPVSPNPVRLLRSRAAAMCIQQLREQADFIVLDTPAVLPLADAQVLTTHADATVMVISSQDTGRRDVTRTLGLLGQSGTEVIGIVLNKTTGREGDHYYGYHEKSLAKA